jgi:hypothetical protein
MYAGIVCWSGETFGGSRGAVNSRAVAHLHKLRVGGGFKSHCNRFQPAVLAIIPRALARLWAFASCPRRVNSALEIHRHRDQGITARRRARAKYRKTGRCVHIETGASAA